MTRESDLRHQLSLIAFFLGVALLWPLPLGAAVLMVTATFALVISWEEELDLARPPNPPISLDSPRLWKETQ
jgi:hypothetical protein